MNDKAPNFDLEFEEVTAAPSTPDPDVEVPEKYKGKSVIELIEMHRNAEKVISRQGQDLSEQRRLSDAILGLKKENAKAPETPPEPVTVDEVFADPNKAIDRVIRSSEVGKKAEQVEDRLETLERSLGQKEFESRHPSYMRDAQDPQFQEWVKKNKSRGELLARLHYNYDFQAGNDLWDMWNEARGNKEEDDSKRKDVLKAARTVRSGPSESSSKPTYSRAKLLALQEKALKGDQTARLKWNDPEFQREYLEAYREGRIR